ncbi:MAG: site-specific integrase, partial [Gammaproteobacteria bacterium]|nr:site-specific integrase [Gammaproteobacteria bacterium]
RIGQSSCPAQRKIMANYRHIKGRKTPWRAHVRVTGFPAQSRSFATKAQARAWAEPLELQLKAQKRHGQTGVPHGLLVGDLVERYLTDVAPHHRGSHAEELRLRRFQREDALAQLGAAETTPKDFAVWRDRRLKKVKSSTVIRELNMLHRIYELARKEWGLAIANPIMDLTRPKAPPGRVRRLNADEEKFLLLGAQSLRAPYMKHLIPFAVATAMRRGELVALDWRWVDWSEKRISIPADVTKNGKPRALPLYKTVRDILEGIGCRNSGSVFGTTADGIKKAWARSVAAALKLYGTTCAENGQPPDADFLRDIHFHDLRHEATSRLLELGLSLPEVQSITGHTMASMVQRYAHLRADTLADKLDAMKRDGAAPDDTQDQDVA